MKRYISNILIGTAAIIGAGALTSCADDLDVVPDGRMDMEEVFSTPENIQGYLCTAWTHIPLGGFGNYFFENYLIDMADEGWSVDENETLILNDIYDGNKMEAASHRFEWDDRGQGKWDGGFWKRYWEMVRICNNFLIRIQDVTCLSDADKSLYEAECRTIRAFYYLRLVRFYGDLPIITDAKDVNSNWGPVVREPAWKVLQHIVDECDLALQSPELPWHITSRAMADRMTKGIACAIKSQAALFAASPLYCHDENLWEWAYQKNLEAFNDLIANGYALYTELQNPKAYYSAYQEYHATMSYAGQVAIDKETIWGSNRVPMALYNINAMPNLGDGTFKAGTIPTQELVDAYDMLATGKPIYDLRKPYLDEKHLQPNYDLSSGYDPQNPYAGRDPRFAASIYYDGCKVNTGIRDRVARMYNNTAAVDDNGNIIDGAGRGKRANCGIDKRERRYTRTGYYNRKRHGFQATLSTGKAEGNWKYFHLAEVYLNLAEAAIEANHIPEGLKLINDIRHRAGFDPSVDVQTSDKDYARLLVHHERQVELAFEEHRYYDCRRWGKPGADNHVTEEIYNTGMWITTDPSNDNKDIKYTRFVLRKGDNEWSKYSAKGRHRLVPIPLKDANNLVEQTGKPYEYWQNPGY